MFFSDPTKVGLDQLDRERYSSLVSGQFKVAETGVVTAEDRNARNPALSEFRYFEDEFEGRVFRRDRSFSTRVVASDCSTFYLYGKATKSQLKRGILTAEGSQLTDSQLLELISKQALEPLNLKARIEYDRFEKRYRVATPEYNKLRLRGTVNESGNVLLVQLYVDLVFNESWGFVRNAVDTDGRSHGVIRIDTNTDCKTRLVGCLLTETVGIQLDQAYLESKRGGFEIKAFGAKEKIIKVPGEVVEAFLAGLERAKRQERDTSN
jgi:hypothetical protein